MEKNLGVITLKFLTKKKTKACPPPSHTQIHFPSKSQPITKISCLKNLLKTVFTLNKHVDLSLLLCVVVVVVVRNRIKLFLFSKCLLSSLSI